MKKWLQRCEVST